jgi:hypothetical protein
MEKNIFQTDGLCQNQAEVAILIYNKIDVKPRLIRIDKEGHFTLIKGTIHQKLITIVNTYTPNADVPNSLCKCY